MSVAIITGSAGLIGSEASAFFGRLGFDVVGIDNDMRRVFFGDNASTKWQREQLEKELGKRYRHIDADIRDYAAIEKVFKKYASDIKLIIHTAAQPSHDWAAREPITDFTVNANGTLNILEAARLFAPQAVFIFTSTNKVYGDAPNRIKLVELEKRWDYADEKFKEGIAEDFTIDQSKHSIFGASKAAADLMVQEYGRYFSMNTCCLRGGCLTGPNHSGVELHGFLSYLVKTNLEGRVYKVYGYKGKQVRDNIHSLDVARLIELFIASPRIAEVYNLGGGRGNSCSILEAFELAESITGKKMKYEYVDKNREGDHICYLSDLRKIKTHYPGWDITIPLPRLFSEIVEGWEKRGLK